MNNNEHGEGFLEVFIAIGAAAFFLIAIGIPVADAYRLQAQADADIAAANLIMAQGLCNSRHR